MDASLVKAGASVAGNEPGNQSDAIDRAASTMMLQNACVVSIVKGLTSVEVVLLVKMEGRGTH